MLAMILLFGFLMGVSSEAAAAQSIENLYNAVSNGDLELVTAIIGAHPEWLDMRSENGQTPLILAIGAGHNTIAGFLIDHGANTNLADDDNWSPLHHAVEKQNAECVKLLLEREAATINTPTKVQSNALIGGWTPLHIASFGGNPELAKLLLDHGADVNARDGVERTPLICAAEANNVNIAEMLINHGADLNATAQRGYSALLWAARNRSKGTVELLIARKALIPKEDLPRAAELAAVTAMDELFQYVLESDYDLEELSQRDPELIFAAAEGGSADIVRSMIKHGFKKSRRDKDGWTPLHSATVAGHIEVVGYLLDAGMDINERNAKGESAFNLASMNRLDEVTAYLKKPGADPDPPKFPLFEGLYMG